MPRDDGRLEEAKAIPLMDVADRLGVDGLRRAGHEHVGPCPDCGGDDRFGINPKKNVFGCRKCGAKGDGIALVELVHRCDFKQALAFLVGEADATIDPALIAERKARAAQAQARRDKFAQKERDKAIRQARDIWDRAKGVPVDLVKEYLEGRGIILDPWPPSLQCLTDHRYVRKINGQFETLHRGPCMIAGIQNAANKITAVHQTWIDPTQPGRKAEITRDGRVFPAKLVRGSKKGGAIRLSPMTSSGIMIMGEGIETTATALCHAAVTDAVYWAGVDLGNMAGVQERVPGTRNSGLPDMSDHDAWVPPKGITRLIFIQDGDSAAKPTRAKLESGLRRAMRLRPGLIGSIVHPGKGLDLNDLVQPARQHEGGL